MALYEEMTREELESILAETEREYQEFLTSGLKLDMSRGKPSSRQLDLSEGLLSTILTNDDCITADGVDCRNYGELTGIREAKKLMGDIMGVPAENVIVCGNSSLSIMFDAVSHAYTHGVTGNTPWCRQGKVKFLCPVPGYDRHFGITEYFGIEMINVPLHDDGPDMDMVESLTSSDASVKGIWCVPKYSNPTGITYSDETVRRFAALTPAAPDFRIFWDNAYCLHNLTDMSFEQDDLPDILSECERAGNPDMVYLFASTSKISYAGGGIAAIASSAANLKDITSMMKYKIIGYDKINMLRHVRYFKNYAGVCKQMQRHAELMRVNFNIVEKTFREELGGTGICSWKTPKGGYFISFNAMPGCAKAIIAKAAEAGLVLTEAGAAFPYHKDPEDSNIRIAPSVPSQSDIEKAAKLFTICVKLVSINRILERRR